MAQEPRIIKAHCPECGPDRKAHVRGEHTVYADDEGDGTSASDTGMVLECCGCEAVYFRHDLWFSEWDSVSDDPLTGEPMLNRGIKTTYWPRASKRRRPHWLSAIQAADDALGELMVEMYDALASDLRVLAAVGARTVFDRASEKFGVNPAERFAEKLDYLARYGHISHDEHEVLNVLVDAGNAAAHRAWKPSIDELMTMVDVLESFLHRSFIVGDGVKKLKASVPPRPRRTK